MKIIISPAKKMRADAEGFPISGLPRRIAETERLLQALRAMDAPALQALWKCNDELAALNVQRVRDMDLRRNLTPAILAYDGLQYRHMAPGVFTQGELDYVQAHLRILSGFYGALAPLDGVVPYRLEMQAKLRADGAKDLYAFWGEKLYLDVLDDDRTIINLASREYARAIEARLRPGDRFITADFLCGGEAPRMKATLAKAARGEMLRFMAENRVESAEDMKAFHALDFEFCPERSDGARLTFIQRPRDIRRGDF